MKTIESSNQPRPAVEQIWIKNFQESANQLQIYILSGLGAAMSFLLISLHSSQADGKAFPKVMGIDAGLDVDSTLFLAFLVYYFFGGSANHAAFCAVRSIRSLRSSPDIVEALFGHPSVALTFPSAFFLILGPAAIMVLAMAIVASHPGAHPLTASKLAFLLVISPYLTTLAIVFNLFVTKRQIIRGVK
jgi:hypothetical protein